MAAMQEYFEVRRDSTSAGPVEVFSDTRLPFEPKGWLLELRSAIGRSVKDLVANNEEILYASYVSSDNSRCDAENVLFYNVGASNFKEASRNGLIFERSFESALPAPSGQLRPHYHCYAIKPLSAGPENWVIRQTLAKWAAPLQALKDPSRVWFEIRPHIVKTDEALSGFQGPFGLDIELQVPDRSFLNMTSVIKPLLDGLISAFHTAEGTPPVEVVERLASRLGVTEQAIHHALANKTGAFLGPRRLVVARAEGVQWNPADDLCLVCKIRVNYGSKELSVRGSAFKIVPKSQPREPSPQQDRSQSEKPPTRTFHLSRQGRCPVPSCTKVFRMGHLGIDEHAYRVHGHELSGSTKIEKYQDFRKRYPRPWPDSVECNSTAAMPLPITKKVDSSDYTHSTYREKLLEHLFISEILQEAWVKRNRQIIEVLRSEIDASGYDVVLASGKVVRHVQLKASRIGALASKQNVNMKLADKPAGCVVWMQFEEVETTGRLKLEYLFFGGRPNEPLPIDVEKHKP